MMYSNYKLLFLFVLTLCLVTGCSHVKQPTSTVKSQKTFTAEEVQVIIDGDRKGLVYELRQENTQLKNSVWRQQRTLDMLDKIRMECRHTLDTCLGQAGECIVELMECKERL